MSAHIKIPLGEVCTVNPRTARTGHSGEETAVSFVPMAAVDERFGTIAVREERSLAEVSKGFTAFMDGDVLFAKITPCMENGKAALARNLTNGVGRGSTEFYVLRPGDRVLSEYIYHFVRQPGFREAAKRSFTGTAGQQRVPKSFMENALLPIPTLDEQRRIVDVLNRAARIERLRARAAERLREFIPALFIKMFGDPVENPMGWQVEPLGDLCVLTQYGTSKRANDRDEGVPILRMGNVTYDGDFDCANLKYIELTEIDIAKHALRGGDILFNRTNSKELVGKTGLWDDRFQAVAASYFIRLRLDQAASCPGYVWAFMNSTAVKRRLLTMARGAIGQANINAKELRSIPVPVPPIALQRRYAEIVETARAAVTVAGSGFKTAAALSGSLMTQMLKDDT